MAQETAETTIDQSGVNIKGVGRGTMLNEQTEWRFDGEIHQNKYIDGYYESTYKNDPLRGNFLLYRQDDSWIGRWIAYDGQDILSGKYELVPMLESFHIDTLSKSDGPTAIQLLKIETNIDYDFTDCVEESLDEDSPFHILVARATDELSHGQAESGDIIGVVIAELQEESNIESFLEERLPVNSPPEELVVCERAMAIHALAIRSDCQGRGVGTKLLESCRGFIPDVPVAYAVIRDPSLQENIDGVMSHLGFRCEEVSHPGSASSVVYVNS